MLSVTWGRRYRTSVALEMWSYQALVQTTLLVPLRACALFLDSLFKATAHPLWSLLGWCMFHPQSRSQATILLCGVVT
jgi:hypothetical protein